MLASAPHESFFHQLQKHTYYLEFHKSVFRGGIYPVVLLHHALRISLIRVSYNNKKLVF